MAAKAPHCPPTPSQRDGERGSILVMTALTMVTLLAITALSVDTSYFFDYRNKMGAAADAAALAGARELKRNSAVTSDALAYFVKHETAANGFTDGSNGVVVTVNHPPTSGPFNGNSKYVEVIVARAATPTFFARMLNRATVDVGARAVAGLGSGTGCIYSLSSDASKAFETSGASAVGITVPACDIYDNSANSNAFFVNSGWTVTAKSINVVGGTNISGTVSPAPTTGTTAVADPFAYLNDSPPAVAAVCDAAHTNVDYKNVTVTIDPGTYCGGITVDGSSVVSFNPGIYVIKNGNFVVKDTATVQNTSATDDGITFYYSGTISPSSFTNGTHIHLKATKSGTWAGILFYDPLVKTSTSNIFDSDDQAIDGVVYFAGEHIEWKGSGGAYTILVADTLKFTGNSTLYSNFASIGGVSPVGGSPSIGE